MCLGLYQTGRSDIFLLSILILVKQTNVWVTCIDRGNIPIEDREKLLWYQVCLIFSDSFWEEYLYDDISYGGKNK
jgi:hypothetical protein